VVTPLLTAAATLAAVLVGYGLGRLRPLVRLDDWVWDMEPARHAARWWLREFYAALMIATHPWVIPRALRVRREQRAKAAVGVAKVEYDPDWASRPTEEGPE
jgi:hypothetical protein